MRQVRGQKTVDPLIQLLSSLIIAGLLLVTAFVSPLLYAVFGASSGAAGVFIIAGIYLFIFALHITIVPVTNATPVLLIVTGMFVAIVAQGTISNFINHDFDFTRFGQSLLLLLITTFGALSLASLSRTLTESQADLALRIVFHALLLCGLVGIWGYTPLPTDVFWKAVFLFAEPSHYALTLLPFLLYVSIRSGSRMQLLFISTSLLLGWFLESLTLLVGGCLIAAMVVPWRQLAFMVTLMIPIAVTVDPEALFSVENLEYYVVRIDLSEENQHLSALAFKQGWEMAYLSLEKSFGLGVGFQQFGIVGGEAGINEAIAKLNEGEGLNRLDGGTVGAKFLGEFGILGVITLSVYLIKFLSVARVIRSIAAGRVKSFDAQHIFFLSCFTTFTIDLFVRGTGYFSPSGFLFVSSLADMGLRRFSGAENGLKEILSHKPAICPPHHRQTMF